MKKFLIYLVASILIITIAAMVGLRSPSVQDRIMVSVVSGMINASNNLPQEDALSAAVCGSRSPIPSPGRAETCVMVRAGENIYIVDFRNVCSLFMVGSGESKFVR